MRTASLPPIRVEPETRAQAEAVLREGESLTQFIEQAVKRETAWRTIQDEFVARGLASLEQYRRDGPSGTMDEALARSRAHSARLTEQLKAAKARRKSP